MNVDEPRWQQVSKFVRAIGHPDEKRGGCGMSGVEKDSALLLGFC